MSKSEKIGNYTVYLDQTYYLAYAGGHRELPKKHQEAWDKTKNLPGILQVKERNALGMDNNPNVIPMKGSQLMSFIKEMQFVPFFDRAFHSTHIVTLTDVIVFESIKQKSYEIALRGK